MHGIFFTNLSAYKGIDGTLGSLVTKGFDLSGFCRLGFEKVGQGTMRAYARNKQWLHFKNHFFWTCISSYQILGQIKARNLKFFSDHSQIMAE